MSVALPLNAKLEVRETTAKDLNRLSAVISSSTMPSAKYSCCGSSLRFANGITAMVAAIGADGMAGGSRGGRTSR